MMAKDILVLLRSRDRVEHFIPYIERIAQRKMRVIFLVPYPVESWVYWRDHWVTTESSRGAMSEGREIMGRYSWETQRRLAEQRVFPAREALGHKGVKVSVEIYTGHGSGALQSHARGRDIHLILVRAGIALRIMKGLYRTTSLFGLFKRVGSCPMLLLDPNAGV